MKKIILFLALILLISGCAKQREEFQSEEPFQEGPPQGSPCYVPPGEWHPEQGDCPGTTTEMRVKCEEFCVKHPDCCAGRQEGGSSGRSTSIALPEAEEVSKLTRNYPTVIKCINEGPNIYSKTGPGSVISNEKLEKIKESGFNTIQIYLMGEWEGDKIVFDETNKPVLLNNIITIKKHGFAVWVALSTAGGPPVPGVKLGESYESFKPAFLNLVDISSELMEQYKVEYFTVNNEPDKYFAEQTSWGSKEQVNNYLADFFISTTLSAKQKFKGKQINKITTVRQHPQSVIDASLKNIDIAGVDVGPPMEGMSLDEYKEWFDDYQFYATAAQKKGISWMNAEYWQYDFDVPDPGQFIKNNELKYAQVSFDAYLKTTPKGVGYTWNDFSAFEQEPNGENTRLAIKNFFSKI